jgi:hypothetical protein
MQSPNGTGTIMSRRRRAWLILGLAVVLVAAFIAFLLHQVSLRRRAAAIDSAIQNAPLTISVSENAFRGGWDLEVDAAGNATLKINSFPLGEKQKTRKFVVPKAQLDELRKALQREHFFALDDSYGNKLVDDGSSTTLEVYAGNFIKAVELYSMGVEDEPQRLREPSRALRVLQIMLAWFNDPEIKDQRKWNQMLIDAAGRK